MEAFLENVLVFLTHLRTPAHFFGGHECCEKQFL